jgi:hypothetical protein
MPKSRKRKRSPKRVLALPDLEQSRAAVLNSLTSKSGQRSYDHAITDFVEWYCSEPRLAFNRTVVLRYRIYLEQKQYAPTTINLAWQPFGGSPMRPPIPDCSVQNWRQESDASKESAGLESVSGTGSRQSRASDCWQAL